MSRAIALDVHRDFCEVAISEGGPARLAGRVAARREPLELFARSLAPTDRVVLEAIGIALAIARILEPNVADVVLAHPKRLRAISHAKIKTDKFDARAGGAVGGRADPDGVGARRVNRRSAICSGPRAGRGLRRFASPMTSS